MGTPQLMELDDNDAQEKNSLKELEALQKIFPFVQNGTNKDLQLDG